MRLFLGCFLPDGVNRTVDGFARRLREDRGGQPELRRWTLPADRHVTLQFLGDRDDPEAVIERAGDVLADIGPFEVRLTSPAFFLSPEALVLTATGAESAAEALRGAFHPGEAGRPFRGHVTLGWGRAPQDRASYEPARLDARWTARSIALAESRPGASRRYRVLHEFGLGGAR